MSLRKSFLQPRPTGSKVVRKESLLQRAWNAPQDWFLSIQEEYETLDWENIQVNASLPVTLAANALFLFSKFRHVGETTDDEEPLIRYKRTQRDRDSELEDEGSWFSSPNVWLALLECVLLLCSFGNAYYLFTRRRKYQLLHLLEDDGKYPETATRSPNMRTVLLDDVIPDATPKSIWRTMLSALWKSKSNEEITGRMIIEINMWNPSIFGLNFFCGFSPPQVLIMHYIDREIWIQFSAIAAIIAFTLHYLSNHFSNLVRDKQIVFGQMYNEYNISLVNAKVFSNCMNKSAQTDPLAMFDYEEERYDSRYQVEVAKMSEKGDHEIDVDEDYPSDVEETNKPRPRYDITPAEKFSPHKSQDNVFQPWSTVRPSSRAWRK